MRIVQVGKYYPPHHGGIERVVAELSEGFVERGHQVRALVSTPDAGASSREQINGVEVVRLKTLGSALNQPLAIGFRREILAFNPDVVHFHAPNPLALSTSFFLPRSVRQFMTIHAEASGAVRRWIDRSITGLALKNIEAAIFSSEETAKYWTGRSASAADPRFRIIPFGFRFCYLSTEKCAPDPKLILFVGRLVPYKGLEYLLRAMKPVDARLAVIGEGPLRPALEKLVLDLGLESRVQFLGALPDSGLSAWYQACAVYVQPSISASESFGITMLEAMHFSKPVISTDLPTGVRSVNLHRTTGLVVPPKDERALTQALESLLQNPALVEELGRGAHAHLARFSHGRMIDLHLELYGRV